MTKKEMQDRIAEMQKCIDGINENKRFAKELLERLLRRKIEVLPGRTKEEKAEEALINISIEYIARKLANGEASAIDTYVMKDGLKHEAEIVERIKEEVEKYVKRQESKGVA